MARWLFAAAASVGPSFEPGLQPRRTIDQAIRLSWVAHNLERVADRVSNLCERVVFAVHGRMEELAAP